MFEARAMIEQFKTYTDGITLCPFGGQPSIPYKYKIADYLQRQSLIYNIPIMVLYFGDLDEAGLDIYQAGRRDISKWCDAEIEFVRCGLTEEQVEEYGVPENPEHPGYQWEALSDDSAREIITDSIAQYYDFDEMKGQAETEADEVTEKVRNEINERMKNEE